MAVLAPDVKMTDPLVETAGLALRKSANGTSRELHRTSGTPLPGDQHVSPPTAGFNYVFHHFGAPDSPDCTFSMVSEPEEPKTVRFPRYVRLSGRLKSRLGTRLGTRLGPRRGASGLTFSLFS